MSLYFVLFVADLIALDLDLNVRSLTVLHVSRAISYITKADVTLLVILFKSLTLWGRSSVVGGD